MLELITRGKKGIYWTVGTIGGRRHRRSTRTASEAHAQAILAKRQCELLDRFTFGEERTLTFSEAVKLHLSKKMATIKPYDAERIKKLNQHFGPWRVRDIKETDVAAFAARYYPRSGPHGQDRSVYTPLIAILRRAAKARLCEMPCFQRPEKPERERVNPATDRELVALLPCCSDRLKAATLFMSFTAARVAEACRVEKTDLDWEAMTAALRITKNGDPRTVPLPGLVLEALHGIRNREGMLFGFSGRHSLNQALERACKRAGLRVMTSHEVGRHAFAARLLGQGFTLKQVQEAGGWKSYRMVAEVYGHLEKSSVHAAMRVSDTKLAQLVGATENVVRIQEAAKLTASMST